jgi:hypothetical protein
MSIKLVVKIIIASATFALYKIFHAMSYVTYNALAIGQLENSTENYVALQTYKYILDYSWIVVAIIMLILFAEDVIKLVKCIKEKNDEIY